MELTKELLFGAFERLLPGGLLALEIGETQGEELKGAAVTTGFLDCEIINDLADKPRFLWAKKPI